MVKIKLKNIPDQLIRKEDRFETNPFLKGMEIRTRKRQIGLSTSEKKANENLLVNRITGDTEYTQIVSYRQVDESEFIKIFSRNIALTFNLESAGVKALNVLIFAVQNYAIGKDVIPLGKKILNEFQKEFDLKLAEKTFRHGITNLVENQIIAKTMYRGEYFINPNFIFNGNRLTLIDIIEKKEKKSEKVTKFSEINE